MRDFTNEQLVNILNHMAGAGIYVIRQDTHEIMFFNERVKEVKPEVALGKVCHELFDGECLNCPLNEIGDKDYITRTNYDDTFGDVVDITANRIIWDEIPAYIITIVNHIVTQEERRMREAESLLIAATHNEYTTIMTLDLHRDTYSVIGGSFPFKKDRPHNGCYSYLVESVMDSVPMPYNDEIRQMLSIPRILSDFRSDKKAVVYRFRYADNNRVFHWLEARILCGSLTHDNEKAILLLSVVDREKNRDMEYHTFLYGITAMFGECFIVNTDEDTYTVIKTDGQLSDVPTAGSFSTFQHHYMNRLVHPDDRATFYDRYNMDKLKDDIRRDKQLRTTELRRMGVDGKYHWAEFAGVYVPMDTGKEHVAILLVRNIAQLKLSQNEKMEYMNRFSMAVRNSYYKILEANITQGILYNWIPSDEGVRCIESKISDLDLSSIANRVHASTRDVAENMHNSEFLWDLFSSGESTYQAEILSDSKDGKYRWYLIQVQPLSLKRDDFRIITFIKDVDSARRDAEGKSLALLDALEIAEHASAAKTDFLSRMSHDIRTPMNAIIGMSRIAQDHIAEPARIADSLKKIDVSAKYLLSLINDILDMSKIESGKLTLDEQQFSLKDLINDVFTVITQQASIKKQTFALDIPNDLAEAYYGDALRLNQILINLLDNAVKYTPEGGEISLTVKKGRTRNNVTLLSLIVKDNGIGMSEEFLSSLYQPFVQESSKHGGKGTGLGMAITRSLVQLMHGEIFVRSRKNVGTMFRVEISLSIAGAVQPAQSVEITDKMMECLCGKRILVVEDNEINMEITCTLLNERGFLTEQACNGAIALKVLQERPIGYFDLILMDIMMPVMDGLQSARAIRSLPQEMLRETPILALTANAFKEDVTAVALAGMDGHIAKPVDADNMLREIARQLL